MYILAGGIEKMENKQRPVIAETRELVQKYHVLEKAQIYAYFALDGRDHFVGKAPRKG